MNKWFTRIVSKVQQTDCSQFNWQLTYRYGLTTFGGSYFILALRPSATESSQKNFSWKQIDSVFKAFDERLDTTVDQIRHLLESSEQLQEWLAQLETSKTRDESPQAEHGGTTVETAPKSNSWPPIEDIQSEFAAIKDTLTKVKLRADLRLCDSRQGIRRSDQTTHDVCLF